MGQINFLAKTFLACSLLTAQVSAQPADFILVDINSSAYVDVGFNIKRLAAGNPEIANVKPVGTSNSEILIEGYQVGSTSLLLWDQNEKEPVFYEIIVSPEDIGQAYLIEELINLPDVRVRMLDDRILLTGTVENEAEHEYALKMVALYINELDAESMSSRVLDLIKVPPSKIKTEPQSENEPAREIENFDEDYEVIKWG